MDKCVSIIDQNSKDLMVVHMLHFSQRKDTYQILINDCQQQLLFPPQPWLEVFKAL